MRRLIDLLGAAVEWLDVVVLALLVASGIGLVVVLALGGGSVVEIALVVLFVTAIALRWLRTSWAGDKLRGR